MDLKGLRTRIDEIDDKVIDLLNERMAYAKEIGITKEKDGEPYFRPDRESEILKRLAERCNHLSKKGLVAIYHQIFAESLNLESPLCIAYLGPQATFTHQAAEERFGKQAKFLPQDDIGEVFMAVEKGTANFGVVPIENSSEGIVSHTLDIFIDSNLKICDEIFLEVSHCLLSNEKSIADIRVIYSHPQGFAQCRNWLAKNLPKNVDFIEVSSTAKATQKASEEKGSGAIASKWAGEVYGLPILTDKIEDFSENTTRFLVIGKYESSPTGSDRTSILFSVKDRPGALHNMLAPFAKYNINLTKIESRPSKARSWEYIFFIDFE
ncbi:MAG: prephenate dehydratase, partial [Candidatus Desantisbacteria bacterium]